MTTLGEQSSAAFSKCGMIFRNFLAVLARELKLIRGMAACLKNDPEIRHSDISIFSETEELLKTGEACVRQLRSFLRP